MAMTYIKTTQSGPYAYIVWWLSDLGDPTYYVWRDGVLVAVTTQTVMTFMVDLGDTLVVDVFDDVTDQPDGHGVGRAHLNWYQVDDADYYRIDEDDGGWTERAQITDDGSGYFSWTSRFLEDVTTHTFRIVPVDAVGNEGDAVERFVFMVRYPDAPSTVWSYDDATGEMTIV